MAMPRGEAGERTVASHGDAGTQQIGAERVRVRFPQPLPDGFPTGHHHQDSGAEDRQSRDAGQDSNGDRALESGDDG